MPYNVLILWKAAIVILYVCHLCARRGHAYRHLLLLSAPAAAAATRHSEPSTRAISIAAFYAPLCSRSFACLFYFLGERRGLHERRTWTGVGSKKKFGVWEPEHLSGQYLMVRLGQSEPPPAGIPSSRGAQRRFVRGQLALSPPSFCVDCGINSRLRHPN